MKDSYRISAVRAHWLGRFQATLSTALDSPGIAVYMKPAFMLCWGMGCSYYWPIMAFWLFMAIF